MIVVVSDMQLKYQFFQLYNPNDAQCYVLQKFNFLNYFFLLRYNYFSIPVYASDSAQPPVGAQ